MVRLSTANTYSYQKGELPLLVAQPACWHPEQHQPVLTGPFPAVDLPFQKYVEQLLHPQDPTSLGNGEPDLGSSRVGRRHSALPRCQDPCTLLCSLLADTLYFFGDNNFTEWASLFQHYSPPTFSLLGTTPAYSFGIAGGCPAKSDWGVGVVQIGFDHQLLVTDSTGAGSGVPFHWHGPGFSEVIYGRKVSTG